MDFDFFGHQLVIHRQERRSAKPAHDPHSEVDGHDVPVPHFGVVLEWDDWHALAARLTERGTRFVLQPGIRFKGQVGEQATMFLLDPCGNALEFKSFRDMGQLFAVQVDRRGA